MDCTLSANFAAGGGAIANAGSATLTMCTLSGNTAAAGGGIDNLAAASATLEDTLVAANVDSGGAASDIGGANAANVTGTFDVVGTGGSGGITGTGDVILTTLAGLGLAPLGNYDGPNATIALLPGSPAIGAGTAIDGIIADERGELLDTPAPDVGAFQSQGFVVTPVTGSTPQTTIIGTDFSDPLAVTVTANNPDEPVADGVATFAINPACRCASANLFGHLCGDHKWRTRAGDGHGELSGGILHRHRVNGHDGDRRVRPDEPVATDFFGSRQSDDGLRYRQRDGHGYAG